MKKIFSKLVTWSLILGLALEATPVWALSKDETIYAKLNSDGSTNSITVSEHLNNNGNMEIIDRSHLNNINNVNGDETYTKKDDKLVWETKGNDIYYQGDTSEELPISIDVKYYLNDEEMSVKEMLGKAGKVKIVINYKNNKVNYVLVNGKVETLYTPFVVGTTSLLDNTSNKNIKVTNGRVIDNGVTSIVVSIASPGLYESLGIKELKDIDKTIISYDTTDFELSSIYSVATSKILEDEDLDVLNNVKDLYSGIGALQDNMNKLVSASGKIKEGSKKLANGTNELNKGITTITNTYYKYRNTDKEVLKKELMALLNKNMKSIIPLLQEEVIKETQNVIKENKKELQDALVKSTIKNTKEVINGEIERIVNNIDVNDIVGKIIGSDLRDAILSDESIKKLSTVFKDELNKEIQEEVEKTTKETINGLSSAIEVKMTDEEKKAYIQSIAEKYNVSFEQAAGIANEVQTDTINGVKNSLNKSSDQISKTVGNKVVASLNNKEYVNGTIKNYVVNVNQRIKEIIDNDENLKEYQKELIKNISDNIRKELSKDELIKKYTEASNYVDGLVDTIIEKTANELANKYTEKMVNDVVTRLVNKQLSEENVNTELGKIINKYEKDIDEKLKVVDENVNKLKTSVDLLNNGSNELAKGISLFDDGLNKYNKEGIGKLSKLINGDVKSIEGKVEALIKLSNDYKTLDDISTDASGSSKIIFMIDSVKKEKEKKVNDDKIVEKKTIIEKIKGLFK